MNVDKQKFVRNTAIVALLVFGIPLYIVSYWTAWPSLGKGRAIIIASPSSDKEIVVGSSSVFFEAKITSARIFSPKHIELKYWLKKPDGEVVQPYSFRLTRGLEFADIFYIVPQNGTIIEPKEINLPGVYELSAEAKGYTFKPITFTVKDSLTRQAVNDLFISNLNSYKLAEANYIDTKPAGFRLGISGDEASVAQYEAVYREVSASSDDSLIIYVTTPAVAKQYVEQQIKFAQPDGKISKVDRSMLQSVKSYTNYDPNNGSNPTYTWASGDKAIVLSFTTYVLDPRVKLLLEAYRQKYPPTQVSQ